jgi:hypothetical protein
MNNEYQIFNFEVIHLFEILNLKINSNNHLSFVRASVAPDKSLNSHLSKRFTKTSQIGNLCLFKIFKN